MYQYLRYSPLLWHLIVPKVGPHRIEYANPFGSFDLSTSSVRFLAIVFKYKFL